MADMRGHLVSEPSEVGGGACLHGLVGPACWLTKGKLGHAGEVGAGVRGGAERGSCLGWATGRGERERPSGPKA